MHKSFPFLALLALSACGAPDIATPIVGTYVGSFSGPVVSDAYTVTVAKVDNSTVGISGADFTTVEFPLMETGDLTTSTATFMDGALSANTTDGTLDFSWTTGTTLAFSGVLDGTVDPGTDTDTATGTDTDTDTGTTPAADCNITVPATATVVTSSLNALSGGEDVLVCAGASLNAVADNVTVYVLGDGSVNLTGDNADAWAAGAASINITGSNATAHSTSAATVNLVGALNDDVSCTAVAIDVSAVASGC